MRAAGAVDVIETNLLKNAGWHNMGTARMSWIEYFGGKRVGALPRR